MGAWATWIVGGVFMLGRISYCLRLWVSVVDESHDWLAWSSCEDGPALLRSYNGLDALDMNATTSQSNVTPHVTHMRCSLPHHYHHTTLIPSHELYLSHHTTAHTVTATLGIRFDFECD